MKNLPTEIREKAVEIANAMLAENADEGMAIATGISRAKDLAENKQVKSPELKKKKDSNKK